MYISPRVAQVRNLLVSFFNGSITLVILLIAPLGLAAVIINTLLITVATYVVCNVSDRVIAWMEPQEEAQLSSQPERRRINRSFWNSSLRRRRD